MIAHEQLIARQRRRVPGLAVEHRLPIELAVTRRVGGNRDHFALLRADYQHIADEQQLAAAESAVFPQAFARLVIHAGQETAAQAVEMALMRGWIGEARVQVAILP